MNTLQIYRGTFVSIGTSILFGIIGFAFSTQLFGGLWIIGIFGVIMLLIAISSTGIEFNLQNKEYREYYTLLFVKFGKWKSYTDYNSLSYHGVTLRKTISTRSRASVDLNAVTQTKVFLINEGQNKKLFIKYTVTPQETEALIEKLSAKLDLPIVKYSPPVSQTRLRRASSKGK